MNAKPILLVEDNLDDVALTRETLRRDGIMNDLIVINDGATALDSLVRAAGAGGNPDSLPTVVLLDLDLPKLDGFGVLQQIRADERLRRLPVIILTTCPEQEAVLKCYELYADHFIRKPVSFERLTEAVRQLGLRWVLVDAPPPVVKHVKPDDP